MQARQKQKRVAKKRDGKTSGNNMPTAVSPLAPVLPLASLSPENFERFSRDLVSLLHPKAAVNRFGDQGDMQEGIDLEARFPNGRTYTYQCKRHQKFGPEKIRAAIKAHRRKAVKKHLLLTRVASSAARKQIAKHRNWELWDTEDISKVIRFRLTLDSAKRLVDTYFPGWRQAFLGIPEPGPWLTPEEFFRPWLSRTSIFSHAWTLVGREKELVSLKERLSNETNRVAILVGRGGSGKTRLLRALADEYTSKLPGFVVRFLSPSFAIQAKDIELLGKEPALIIIDDAHDRDDISVILDLVARQAPNAKLLLATRPYALPLLRPEISRLGLAATGDSTVEMLNLNREEAERISTEVLHELGGPTQAAAAISRITHDCLLATVIGSYLVAKKSISPAVLNNATEFQAQLFHSFRDAIEGEIGTPEERPRLKDTLDLIAMLQPIEPDSEAFRSVARTILGQPDDKTSRLLRKLREAGVLIQRGSKIRIVPDLLADYIVEHACVDLNAAQSTGYADRVFSVLGHHELRSFLVNLAKLDWRLSLNEQKKMRLIDDLWNKIERRFVNHPVSRNTTIEAITDTAYYQPQRALTFLNLMQRVGVGNHELVPKLLRHVAYNYEYLPEAAMHLWELGRDDSRPLNQHPDHPIRILGNLASIEPEKPIGFSEAVVDFAIKQLDDPRSTASAYSPFDIIEPALSTEGHTTELSGHSLVFRPYQILFEATAALRTHILNILFRKIADPNLNVAIRAARCLHEALRYPFGMFSHKVTPEERNQWTPEFVATLTELKKIISTNNLDPIVLIELQKAVSWHARYANGPTSALARSVIAALPHSLHHRLTLALVDGWGHLQEDLDDFEKSIENWRSEQRATAQELLQQHPDTNTLIPYLAEYFDKFSSINISFDYEPGPFITVLVEERRDVGRAIANRIISEPSHPLTEAFSIVMGQLITENPSLGLEYAQAAIATHRDFLRRKVAAAYSWKVGNRVPFSEKEIAFISDLCRSDDEHTVLLALNAVRNIAANDIAHVIGILCSIDIGKSAKVANEVLEKLLHAPCSFEILSRERVVDILDKLKVCSSLDGHWIGKFLGYASKRHPELALDLLVERINHRSDGIDDTPFPYGWDERSPLRFRESVNFPGTLFQIMDWIAQSKKGHLIQFWGTKLFAAAATKYDKEVVSILSERAASADADTLKVIGYVISEAPRDFILTHKDFVISLLERATILGTECHDNMSSSLWRSVISGVKSGTVGEPFPEDIQLRDKTAELLENLSPSSPAWKFYSGVKQQAEEDIKRRASDDEIEIE